MKKRLTILFLVAIVLTSILFSGAGYATPSTLDYVAASICEALELGRTTCNFTVSGYTLDDLLHQLFTQYPVLIHYYDRAEGTSYQAGMDVTFYLHNTDDALDEIWIISSDQELLAALGMGMLHAQSHIQFVTKEGYIPSDQVFQAAIEQLHNQFPIVYMGYNGWSSNWYSCDEYGVRDYSVEFKYFYDLDVTTLQQWRRETEQVVLDITSSLIALDMPDYQKVLLIHDWIINHTRYNSQNLDEVGNHLAYGALVKGTCVCMGYAEAGLLLFQAVGVDACYISGTGINSAGQQESHGWNAVNIDGEWYQLDITWDDPTSIDGIDTLRYDYFLVTDRQLEKDHIWEKNGAPVCSNETWNAQKVLDSFQADTTVYTQYHTGNYMSLEKAKRFFSQNLTSAADTIETAMQDSVPQTQPVTNTETLERSANPAIPNMEAEGKGSGGLWWLGGTLIVLIGCAIVIIVRAQGSKREKGRYKPTSKRNSGTRSYVHFD